MGNELDVFSQVGGGAIDKFDDKAFEGLASSDFLPRLQLMVSQSKPCKAGEFPVNNFAFVKDKTTIDLGKEVDVILCAWRPKAMDMNGGFVVSHDQESDLFKDISARAPAKDSGCMYGPEFLVWVPSQKAFASFFMGSTSSRRESPVVKAFLRQACTLTNKHIETSKNDWFIPTAKPCSTPLEAPTPEQLVAELEKFNNPRETKLEVAEDDTQAR